MLDLALISVVHLLINICIDICICVCLYMLDICIYILFFSLSLSMETPGARSFAGLKVAFLIRSLSLENQTSPVQLQNEKQVALRRLQKVSYDILLSLRT